MSFRVFFIGFADGGVIDPNGKITVVGMAPQVIIAREFPAQITTNLILVAEAEERSDPEIQPGEPLKIRAQIQTEDGEVLFLAQHDASIGQKSIPALPHRLQVIGQVAFSAPKEGEYTGTLTVTRSKSGRTEIDAATSIRIMTRESIAA